MHKCVPVDQQQLTPTQTVLSQPVSDLDTSTENPALTNMLAVCTTVDNTMFVMLHVQTWF